MFETLSPIRRTMHERQAAGAARAATTIPLGGSPRRIAASLGPGIVLPGLIYYVASRFVPTIVALAIASAVPALHAGFRLARGRKPSPYGLVFLAVTAVSVGLAVWLRSPMLILARGAVLTAVMGFAFAMSVIVRRPLTRTFALFLSEEGRESRRRLAERWAHPKVTAVFSALAAGWAILLLASAAQQTVLIMTVSPGVVMSVEPPTQALITIVGIAVSLAYVRRMQRRHAEVRLLPAR
jgi:hypothetical protein